MRKSGPVSLLLLKSGIRVRERLLESNQLHKSTIMYIVAFASAVYFSIYSSRLELFAADLSRSRVRPPLAGHLHNLRKLKRRLIGEKRMAVPQLQPLVGRLQKLVLYESFSLFILVGCDKEQKHHR
jgi:hypothetical protein